MGWRWIDRDVVIAIHDQQIAEHGGKDGIRDTGLLESAVSRPRNRSGYEQADVFDLAAEYGYGIARKHAFFDGNKRTAYVATRLFLRLNGFDITAAATDRVIVMAELGKGEISLAQFAAWLRSHGAELRHG